MGEAVKKLIGKECIITTGVGSSVVGIIESVEDSWVVLRSKGNLEMINLDYVSRIREYPRNKNGKKKTVFA
jgi:ferredoxin-fold anticodon binding domain-containing protein